VLAVVVVVVLVVCICFCAEEHTTRAAGKFADARMRSCSHTRARKTLWPVSSHRHVSTRKEQSPVPGRGEEAVGAAGGCETSRWSTRPSGPLFSPSLDDDFQPLQPPCPSLPHVLDRALRDDGLVEPDGIVKVHRDGSRAGTRSTRVGEGRGPGLVRGGTTAGFSFAGDAVGEPLRHAEKTALVLCEGGKVRVLQGLCCANSLCRVQGEKTLRQKWQGSVGKKARVEGQKTAPRPSIIIVIITIIPLYLPTGDPGQEGPRRRVSPL
jgi:hypothetical protein